MCQINCGLVVYSLQLHKVVHCLLIYWVNGSLLHGITGFGRADTDTHSRANTHTHQACVDGDREERGKKSCASPLRGGARRHRDGEREHSLRLYVARRAQRHTHTHSCTLTPNVRKYTGTLRKRAPIAFFLKSQPSPGEAEERRKVRTVPTSSTTNHTHTRESVISSPSPLRNDFGRFSQHFPREPKQSVILSWHY